MDMAAEEQFERHLLAYGSGEMDTLTLRNPGLLHWRLGGEKHINDPDSVAHLQVSNIIVLVVLLGCSMLNFYDELGECLVFISAYNIII